MMNFSVVVLIFIAFTAVELSHHGVYSTPVDGAQLTEVSGSGSGEVAADLPPECTGAYKTENDHTMCKHDDPRVLEAGVSEQDKLDIVNLHNELRANVEPPATDLSKLEWDDNLAAVAEKWAKQCRMGHDANRGVPAYGINVGQNVAGGQSDWRGAIMGWYNEVEMFNYGQDPEVYLGPEGWKKIGHYTQVVQNTTYKVGCGFANCRDTTYSRYYVCNYGKGQSRIAEPYTSGARCADCPHSCNNGLCDCSGKLCLNGGTINIDDCTCSCSSLYQGDTCNELMCPAKDATSCWNSILPEKCEFGYARNSCPFMCGLCGGPEGATPPPVFTSAHNCSFRGQRPSSAECSTFGSGGADMGYCGSQGGSFECTDCEKYSNVKTEYCPVMCALCDPPCDGKMCQNGGTLNTADCTCSCTSYATGALCENINCPEPDPSYCWDTYGQAACTQYSNMPSLCPWMCGRCGAAGATPPPVFVSAHGCEFKGQRPSKETYQAYGDGGKDKSWACASGSGQFGCSDCIQYSNVKHDYCPVMCGACDP